MSIEVTMYWPGNDVEYNVEMPFLPRKGDVVSRVGGEGVVDKVEFYRPGYENFYLVRIYLTSQSI